jgi:DNA-binding IclR family transcriptional regulator
MLAWLGPEQVDVQIGRGLGRLTSRTIGDLSTLHQELNRIRQRRGLAFERGECSPEISCVAAAVRGPEGPLASISMVGDARTPLEKVAPLVVDAARQVSLALHPNLENARRPRATAPDAGGTWSAQTLDRLMVAGQNGDWL